MLQSSPWQCYRAAPGSVTEQPLAVLQSSPWQCYRAAPGSVTEQPLAVLQSRPWQCYRAAPGSVTEQPTVLRAANIQWFQAYFDTFKQKFMRSKIKISWHFRIFCMVLSIYLFLTRDFSLKPRCLPRLTLNLCNKITIHHNLYIKFLHKYMNTKLLKENYIITTWSRSSGTCAIIIPSSHELYLN